jgi:hypothetical protein
MVEEVETKRTEELASARVTGQLRIKFSSAPIALHLKGGKLRMLKFNGFFTMEERSSKTLYLRHWLVQSLEAAGELLEKAGIKATEVQPI